MHIVGTHCAIRSWRHSDASSIARLANDRDIWLNLRDIFPHPYTREDAEEYLAVVTNRDPETSVAIEVDGSAVGNVGMKLGTDVERANAEIGYWLGREYWGRGIVSEALALLTAHAFATLPLNRIYALPFVRNAASCRVLEKAGYQKQARLRSSSIKDDVVLDQWLYDIVREPPLVW
jgi:ribosomal-protein-alanine N-acetyltransferase